MKFLIIVSLVLLVLISGCINKIDDTEFFRKAITDSCANLCKLALSSGKNLDNGPCLSDNNTKWTIQDWVCDIVHSPRQPVDDLPENQCQDFRNGQAHHFVEVDTNCNFIRAV
jgi:hypothetical protein